MSESSGSGVKATVVTHSKSDKRRVEKTFGAVSDVAIDDNNGSHLKSLRNCVNRLETQLNQYLTQIIDDENESNPSVSAVIAGDQPFNASAKHKEYNKSGPNHDTDNQSSTQRPTDGPKQKRCKNK